MDSTFFAVFDIHTGELMQTFFNPSDGHDRIGEGTYGTIHLAPNGKIVTEYAYVFLIRILDLLFKQRNYIARQALYLTFFLTAI